MTFRDPAPSPDARALVVYATTHGHTATIATRIGDAIRCGGVTVDVVDVAAAAAVRPDDYRLVAVVASLHRSHHQPEIVDWVRAHRPELGRRPTVFCSVSLSAAEKTPEALLATQACVDDFCVETGWTPTRTERIAGCLQYREYGVVTRRLMRVMMRRAGRPIDASRDYEYTDWEAVADLGRALAELAAEPVSV